jgi:ribosomal-protein-alanine N-acetyltransferase
MAGEWYEKGAPAPWGVVVRETGRMIGTCGIVRFNDELTSAELGYALGQEHWGKGYATEAAIAVRDFAFRTFPLERLVAVCIPENLASAHILEKIGMTHTGTEERFSAKDDATIRLLAFALDRRDWIPATSGM